MTGPRIVPTRIAAKSYRLWVFSRKRVFSAQWKDLQKTVVLVKLIPADTLRQNDANTQTLVNRIVSDSHSMSSMCSRKLFPNTSLREDTKKLLPVISHLSRILSVFSWPFLFFLCQAELFTPIRNCSVNTELIDRMNDSEKELGV